MLHIEPDDSRTADALAEAIRHACRTGKLSNLIQRLAYLDSYAYESSGTNRWVDDPTRCKLYTDRAPYSFGICMERFDEPRFDGVDPDYRAWWAGGLIFHGPHDGHGSGSAPTFAVTVAACDGWSVHT